MKKETLSFKIVSDDSFEKYTSELEAFRAVYLDSFPDEREREPYDCIVKRIAEKGMPTTYAVLALQDGILLGAEIIIYYEGISDLLISYIAVDKDHRSKGIGRRLLMDGTKILLKFFEKKGMPVRSIYLEVENPFRLSQSGNISDGQVKLAVRRLAFFSSCGALRLPFDYKQPPLSDSGAWVDHLFLLTLPFSNRLESIHEDNLKAYLQAFYKGLGVSDPIDLPPIADEKGRVPLDSLREKPAYVIKRVCVAYHFDVNLSTDNKGLFSCNKKTPNWCYDAGSKCETFNSYECDLMNYSCQNWEDRPFTTHHIKVIHGAELTLPAFYHYNSEGHDFYVVSSHFNPLKIDISLNYSYKPSSDKYMVHVVITPSEGESFTEYDLIKCITPFGSQQERYSPFGENFNIDCGETGKFSSWLSLLEKVIPVPKGTKATYSILRTGASELEFNEIRDSKQNLVIRNFEDYAKIFNVADPMAVTHKKVVPKRVKEWNKALCGIILGIFDFHRMNDPEIAVTIHPSVTLGGSFMEIVHRGHLTKLQKKGEDDYERIANIFISPYHLIPSIALAYNEYVYRKNVMDLQHLDEIGGLSYYSTCIRLAERLRTVSESISSEFMPSIFQYRSEQILQADGELQRGINPEALDKLGKKLDSHYKRLDQLRTKYNGGIDTIQNVLLLLLAIAQAVTAVDTIRGETPLFQNLLVTIGLSIVIVGVIFYFRKRRL